MKRSTEISEELNNISSLLAGIEKKNVFSVPEGYFDALSMGIFKKLNPSEIKTDKLTVPEGYFENLSTSVLHKIKSLYDDPAQELRELSPMLYSIQNENVFEVPKDFFNHLSTEILQKVNPAPAKVIKIKKRDSIWRYAAAAVVTGVIGLISLMNYNTSDQTSISKANEVSVAATINAASQFKNEQQINDAIAMLSDDEIIKYLEGTGSDVDNEVLTTDIDENELPDPNDYLLDEKTLDLYLSEIEQKSSQN